MLFFPDEDTHMMAEIWGSHETLVSSLSEATCSIHIIQAPLFPPPTLFPTPFALPNGSHLKEEHCHSDVHFLMLGEEGRRGALTHARNGRSYDSDARWAARQFTPLDGGERGLRRLQPFWKPESLLGTLWKCFPSSISDVVMATWHDMSSDPSHGMPSMRANASLHPSGFPSYLYPASALPPPGLCLSSERSRRVAPAGEGGPKEEELRCPRREAEQMGEKAGGKGNDGEKKKKAEGGEQAKKDVVGEKKKDKGGEKKKDDGPITVVLKVDMHCEGCARKVKHSVKGFEGVEAVAADCANNKLTVVGKVDPWKLRERIESKTHKQVVLVSPTNLPKKDVAAVKEETKKADEKKTEEKKPKEPPASTVVLKIRLHCEGCIYRIRRTITKIKGVEAVSVDPKEDLVIVKGTMDVKTLPDYLKDRLKRSVAVVTPKKDDGGGTKKEKGEKGGEKKKGGGGDGGAEKKGKEEGGGGGGGDQGDKKKGGDGGARVVPSKIIN
ncbi:hypothetical protein Taro_041473 [Colocasia esculenta]|uniref:HMA domain-containing protein n=1 Tax=Colocasia esculenta TaxID=4460 RepID=A0A843WVZ8_COLES|nr:hypothetical protein [Colocasia esculenta]